METFLRQQDDSLEVHGVETGEAALEDIRADNEVVDGVISDYTLPGMDGIELLRDVRDEDESLPFILFTAKGSEEIASDAISAGVTDYLQQDRGTEQYTLLYNRLTNAIEAERAATEARSQRRQVEQILKTAPSCLVQLDSDGNFIYANQRAKEVLGLTESEVTERAYNDPEWQIKAPDGTPIADEDLPFQQVRVTGEPIFDFQHTIEWPDGTEKLLSVNGAPVLDDDGEIESVVFALSNITERRQQERRYEAVFNNTYTFAGLLSPDGQVLEANDTALSFGGLERSDVVGLSLWETYWFQSGETARTMAKEAVEQAQQGDLFRDEVPIQGSERDAVIDFSVRPITNSRGQVTSLVPEGRDITERKNAERKQTEIINRVREAIVEVDSEWEFVLVNDRAEEIYEMSEEYLLGRNFWDVFDEARHTRFEDVYRQAMNTRESATLVEYFDALDGWFDIQVFPIAGGGLAFYFRDITEHKELSREVILAESRYQTLAENVVNGTVFCFDTDLRYQLVSGSDFAAVDVAPSEFEGHTIHEIEAFSAETREALASAMEATLDGAQQSLDITVSGQTYLLQTSPVRDDAGNVYAGIYRAREVTDGST